MFTFSFFGAECSKVSYEVSDLDDIRYCIACYEADKIKYKDAKYQKQGHGATVSVYEDDWRDDEIDKETEEEFIKVEEDFTNNFNIDGPKSSADLLLPSQPHQSPLFLQQQQQQPQQHHLSLSPRQPGQPQWEGEEHPQPGQQDPQQSGLLITELLGIRAAGQ